MKKIPLLAVFSLISLTGFAATPSTDKPNAYAMAICSNWGNYVDSSADACNEHHQYATVPAYDATLYPGLRPLTFKPCIGDWIGYGDTNISMCETVGKKVTIPVYSVAPADGDYVSFVPCLKWTLFAAGRSVVSICSQVGEAIMVPTVADVDVVDLTPALRKQFNVTSKSGAMFLHLVEEHIQLGLRVGDVAVEINGKSVKNAEDFRVLVKTYAQANAKGYIEVERDGQLVDVLLDPL